MQTTRRFPGLAFRVETPTPVELPRMDIAAFVGFASRGPVQVPVVVESYPDFVNLFGGPYPLAWDDTAQLWQTACLAPAVKAFFGQGGRRCWIVRVASAAAATTTVPLAGLLQSTLNGYQGIHAAARCPGSWADDLAAAVELLVTPLDFDPVLVSPAAMPTLALRDRPSQPLQSGDLLQLDFSDRRHRAYAPLPPTAVTQRGTVTVTPEALHWFHRLWVTQLLPLGLEGTVQTVAPAATATAAATLKASPELSDRARDLSDRPTVEQAILTLPPTFAIEPGDWLRLQTPAHTLWLLADQRLRADTIAIAQVWAAGTAAIASSLPLERVQRLQLTLRVRTAAQPTATDSARLANLALAPAHPRFIGRLPDDAALLAPQFGPGQPAQAADAALRAAVLSPRFPLSLRLPDEALVLPLGLTGEARWRSPQLPPGPPLMRDGLVPPTTDAVGLSSLDWSAFLPSLFIDPYLQFTSQRSLVTAASDRLYLQGQPLTGMHALMPIAEVSLVALPDAAHPGWQLTPLGLIEPDQAMDPGLPDLCAPTGPFRPCPPATTAEPPPGDDDAALPVTLPTEQWQLLPGRHYDATGLLEVQREIAKMVAAQGDRVAILGLPKHYRLPDIQQHQQQLLGQVSLDGETTASYLALYAPWLISRDDTEPLLHTHPAGSMAGVMAARSLTQGAWVAPANEPVQGAIATLPRLTLADEHALYAAGINPIRPTARGFVAWGSYTQSRDPEFEDLNVRRLLILLRRLALREGQTEVFAPHSAAFRRRLQQRFERLLARLFERGALAGSTPTEAYQVVIDDSLNTPATIERGQLIVELRVAPSQPLTFITVRLVQQENSQLTVQEVQTLGG